jgi:hypothetical protein
VAPGAEGILKQRAAGAARWLLITAIVTKAMSGPRGFGIKQRGSRCV